jgi:hypothetical protein
MIMSNIENWRPCEDRSVSSFVTNFVDDFKFITGSGVDLQQDHQGARVQRNTIILSSRGFDFQTNAHLSRFRIFVMKMLR